MTSVCWTHTNLDKPGPFEPEFSTHSSQECPSESGICTVFCLEAHVIPFSRPLTLTAEFKASKYSFPRFHSSRLIMIDAGSFARYFAEKGTQFPHTRSFPFCFSLGHKVTGEGPGLNCHSPQGRFKAGRIDILLAPVCTAKKMMAPPVAR
jgi:hypothetical protein